MRVMIQCMHENNYQNLTFPSKEKELQILCDSLGVANTAKTEIKIGTVYNDERLSALLSHQTVNLDELNFLMKRLDSFVQNELATFFAAAYAEKTETMTELINLSFNTHCYSLVADFSDLNAVGRQMYLTEQVAVSTGELQSLDGRYYFEKMVAENPNPMITPYGVVYRNSNEIAQIYDGRNFPYYQYESTPITLQLSSQNRYEYLYLPIEQSELNKALERLGVESLEEIHWQVEEYNISDNLAYMVVKDQSDLYFLNQFAAIFKEMGQREVTSLSELAAFAKITNAEELKTLASCMYEFECFPDIHTPEQYGRYMICESGRFEYDENLEGYIDFKAYGQDKISRETGAFTSNGYLLYHGYNMEMQDILNKSIGLKIKELQEPQELKLYMPLKAITYQDENDYGDLYQVDYEIDVYPEELSSYEDEIRTAIINHRLDSEKRGMMDYYDEPDTVNAKVQKYLFDVEVIDGELMGVAVLTLNAPLNKEELMKIKEAIEGQCSSKYVLSDILVCGECPHPYRRQTWSRNGNLTPVWRCESRLLNGTKTCKHSATLKEKPLHEAIMKAVDSVVENQRDVIGAFRENVIRVIGSYTTKNIKTEYDEEISKLQKQLLSLIEENAKQGAVNEDFDEQYRKIAEEMQTLKMKKLKLAREQKLAGEYEQRVDGMDSCLGRVSCRVGEFDEDLIRRLILRIKVIHESKIEIHFKYGIIMEQEIEFYED